MRKEWWKELDLTISAIAMGILVFLTIIGVIFRYVVNCPLSWLEEVQLLLIVWSTFLGASAAFRSGQHMCMEFLYEKFGSKGRRVIDILITLVTVLCLALFCYFSIKLIISYTLHHRLTSMLHIPTAVVYGVIPVACVLMVINDIRYFLKGNHTSTESEVEA